MWRSRSRKVLMELISYPEKLYPEGPNRNVRCSQTMKMNEVHSCENGRRDQLELSVMMFDFHTDWLFSIIKQLRLK